MRRAFWRRADRVLRVNRQPSTTLAAMPTVRMTAIGWAASVLLPGTHSTYQRSEVSFWYKPCGFPQGFGFSRFTAYPIRAPFRRLSEDKTHHRR